jgi:hypothetical protein
MVKIDVKNQTWQTFEDGGSITTVGASPTIIPSTIMEQMAASSRITVRLTNTTLVNIPKENRSSPILHKKRAIRIIITDLLRRGPGLYGNKPFFWRSSNLLFNDKRQALALKNSFCVFIPLLEPHLAAFVSLDVLCLLQSSFIILVSYTEPSTKTCPDWDISRKYLYVCVSETGTVHISEDIHVLLAPSGTSIKQEKGRKLLTLTDTEHNPHRHL